MAEESPKFPFSHRLWPRQKPGVKRFLSSETLPSPPGSTKGSSRVKASKQQQPGMLHLPAAPQWDGKLPPESCGPQSSTLPTHTRQQAALGPFKRAEHTFKILKSCSTFPYSFRLALRRGINGQDLCICCTGLVHGTVTFHWVVTRAPHLPSCT